MVKCCCTRVLKLVLSFSKLFIPLVISFKFMFYVVLQLFYNIIYGNKNQLFLEGHSFVFCYTLISMIIRLSLHAWLQLMYMHPFAHLRETWVIVVIKNALAVTDQMESMLSLIRLSIYKTSFYAIYDRHHFTLKFWYILYTRTTPNAIMQQ